MVKLTITNLGAPKTVITVHGPKEKNWLKATEYGDKFLNYWVSNSTKDWKVGQVIEVEAIEEKSYYSKKNMKDEVSLNIKMPKMGGNNAELEARVVKLEDTLEIALNFIKLQIVPAIKQHEERLDDIKPLQRVAPTIGNSDIPYPTEEMEGINLEEAPF